jgi:hypothetical protein
MPRAAPARPVASRWRVSLTSSDELSAASPLASKVAARWCAVSFHLARASSFLKPGPVSNSISARTRSGWLALKASDM